MGTLAQLMNFMGRVVQVSEGNGPIGAGFRTGSDIAVFRDSTMEFYLLIRARFNINVLSRRPERR